jgi:hypothetical protein
MWRGMSRMRVCEGYGVCVFLEEHAETGTVSLF